MTTVLLGARVVGSPGQLGDDVGWLRIDEGMITATGIGAPSPAAIAGAAVTTDLGGRWVVPGFVDVHCHGGGGASVYSGVLDDVVKAARTHLATGTTSMLASVATTELGSMLAATSVVADAIDAGLVPNVVGIHLEGPFLSPRRRGAQTAAALLPPDPEVLERLLAAGRGHVRTMTIAPELPGATDLIRANAARLRFSLGHTDADAEQFRAGIEAGARMATHLFNAMPPLLHRAPGAVGAALTDERVTVELVSDGMHVDDLVLRLAYATAGRARMMTVTDASPAAGLGDGDYRFADRHITVDGGVARIYGTDTLAGSAVTLGEVLPRLVGRAGFTLEDTAEIMSATPARAIGLDDRGTLRVGARADLVVLGPEFRPQAVMSNGTWIE
ncbi:N-acetylglucosamine-6-phosphate deacetylase [Gryllotalpicola reticulitermitis]|uniref:N-acetylglucosamine-6-phosphate deacetylase n=1 Tax=Gryllotalpicola reticulitermitis TaxID=1184153 RepID=A0ABV8QBP9_9MICO